ncbi:MAG: hypothetical protein IRY99_00520, partial [Isosphaeraceae bacterium]|nr:hypothetical protein [Isosphaeraceae bacterium]
MVRPRRLSTPAESVAASFFLQGDDHRRQKILVSIIIPCYNEALGINHTIETLRHELI